MEETSKLFVYGIFLDEHNRHNYHMSNPKYDTVLDYITVGGGIVRAIPSEGVGASLTGLTVDIPNSAFPTLDVLEGGYARIKVKTTGGIEAYMYARHGDKDDYSTYSLPDALAYR